MNSNEIHVIFDSDRLQLFPVGSRTIALIVAFYQHYVRPYATWTIVAGMCQMQTSQIRAIA